MFLFEESGGGGGGHHTPTIVEIINHYVGEPVHHFQKTYTEPFWNNYVFNRFDTTAAQVFGPYTPENAIPWYTIMFVLACIITMVVVWVLKPRKMSEDEPTYGQLTLEAGLLGVRGLLEDNVGPKGMKYFPLIGTFAVLILVSNLMGLVPGLMSPTASTSVTFALGITSFVYYNYIGISENGLLGHLKHFAGPVPWLAVLMLPIELVSNLVRPVSLGVRLFGNLFGDEQILGTIAGLVAWVVPVFIMPLSTFVAFMQTFIFVLLSIIYISEVTHHEDHGEHGEHGDPHHDHPALTDGEQGVVATP